MKRLIVLTAFATLLAFQPGCSILGHQRAESCDTTTSISSKLSRLRNILPWRSATPDECLECNEGFSDVGYIDGQIIDDGYTSGGYTSSGYVESVPSEGLYNPAVVYEGPTVVGTPVESSPVQTYPLPQPLVP